MGRSYLYDQRCNAYFSENIELEGSFKWGGILGKDIGDVVYLLLTVLISYLTDNIIKTPQIHFHDSALISLPMSTVNAPQRTVVAIPHAVRRGLTLPFNISYSYSQHNHLRDTASISVPIPNEHKHQTLFLKFPPNSQSQPPPPRLHLQRPSHAQISSIPNPHGTPHPTKTHNEKPPLTRKKLKGEAPSPPE